MYDYDQSIMAKYTKLLTPFLPLWKTEDKEWLKQRKTDWQYIAEHNMEGESKKRKAELKKFFIKGVYPGYTPILFFLVPFDSEESMKQFFYSDMYSSSERTRIRLFELSNLKLGGLSWERTFNQRYVKAILGSSYQVIKEPLPGGGEKEISPHPSSFCSNFIYWTYRILQLTEVTYHPYVETVDYFVTTLPFFNEIDYRNARCVKEFFIILELAEGISQQADAPVIAKELAEKLVENKEALLSNWQINAHLDE